MVTGSCFTLYIFAVVLDPQASQRVNRILLYDWVTQAFISVKLYWAPLGLLLKTSLNLCSVKGRTFSHIPFGWVDLCLVSRNVLSQVMIQKPAMRKAWIVAAVCPWLPHLLGWVETGLNVAYEGFVPLRKQKKNSGPRP